MGKVVISRTLLTFLAYQMRSGKARHFFWLEGFDEAGCAGLLERIRTGGNIIADCPFRRSS